MKIIREIENYQKENKPLYLALGNFDGVHKGHRKLIIDTVTKAQSNNGLSAAFIFEPHPTKVLTPDHALRMIVTPQRKAELLEELGLDILIYNSFNLTIARWSPEEFVKKILVNRLKVREVFVGFNHSFGHKGAGTPEYLAELGEKYDFRVNIIQPVEEEGELVSSSLIRKALDEGDINLANKMLGHHTMIEGTVVTGERRGSTIGLPTANLEIDPDLLVPAKGVYAAIADYNHKRYKCVVNIGEKPTFHDNHPIIIEAHIMDFNQDIYGKKLRLFFIQKIRDEQKFNSIDSLIKQIKSDRDRAYEIVADYCKTQDY